FQEVVLDVGGCFLARYRELTRETEAGYAIDDAEIDRLGAATNHRVHVLDGNVEHLAGGHRVDVDAIMEGLSQCGNVGDVREETQLDLRIVGGNEDVAWCSDEGLANLATFLGADRDILQVGIGRGEPAGLCAGKRV